MGHILLNISMLPLAPAWIIGSDFVVDFCLALMRIIGSDGPSAAS